MSKIKNGGLDQYGAGPVEQQQFGTAGVEGVKINWIYWLQASMLGKMTGMMRVWAAAKTASYLQNYVKLANWMDYGKSLLA